MLGSRATETCTCGAAFSISGSYVTVEYRLKEFREAHRVCRERVAAEGDEEEMEEALKPEPRHRSRGSCED